MGYLVFFALLLTVAIIVYRQTVHLRRVIDSSDKNVSTVFEEETPEFKEIRKIMDASSMEQSAADVSEKFAMAYVIHMGMKAVALGAAGTRRPSMMKAVANSTFMIITNSSSRFHIIYEGYERFVKEYGNEAGATLVPSERFRLLLERVASVKAIRKR